MYNYKYNFDKVGNRKFNLHLKSTGVSSYLLNAFMKIGFSGLFFAFSILGLLSCNHKSPFEASSIPPHDSDIFKEYWYSGKAELNTYEVEQSRYGETREGSAVLIFVTEDFSKKKQVKLDNPQKLNDDNVKVLKMNFTKNFVTGIYPYSMMLSCFTPIYQKQDSQTIKVSMTAQEWCGQVFTQLNLREGNYLVQSNSYFEKEGDRSEKIKSYCLEDEIWNRIRLNPQSLPTGEIQMIPGLFSSRLLHQDIKNQKALISKQEKNHETIYSIFFSADSRSLIITFQKVFPHKILKWEENFVERGIAVTTKAYLKKSITLDYWTKNKNEFLNLRDSLGLSRTNF